MKRKSSSETRYGQNRTSSSCRWRPTLCGLVARPLTITSGLAVAQAQQARGLACPSFF